MFITKPFRRFLKLEAASGIILFSAAVVAILIKNSGLEHAYDSLLEMHAGFEIGSFELKKELIHWVNDGLMAVFFFLVGLEIKREFLDGELSSPKQAILPALGAVGGMIFPAIVYILIAYNSPEVWKGWAIPCATDIAFSLGILALLGSRVPLSLKVFLTALAIIDDLGAIVIIAVFYSANLKLGYLFSALGVCIALFVVNNSYVSKKTPYVLLGLILWYLVLKSGIHATIAGVLTAFFVPFKINNRSLVKEFEHALHPAVAYFILPIFAFFNAGVSLKGMSITDMFSTLTIAVALGLFIGKQIGVVLFSWLTIKTGLAELPNQATFRQFYAVAILTGVGFTMSLFIETLAFSNPELQAPARLGILSGSFLSGLAGYLVLRASLPAIKSEAKS